MFRYGRSAAVPDIARPGDVRVQRLAGIQFGVPAAHNADRRSLAFQAAASVGSGTGDRDLLYVRRSSGRQAAGSGNQHFQPAGMDTFSIGGTAPGNRDVVEIFDGEFVYDIFRRTDAGLVLCAQRQLAAADLGRQVRKKIVVGGNCQRFGTGLIDRELARSVQLHFRKPADVSGLADDVPRSADTGQTAAGRQHRTETYQQNRHSSHIQEKD